MRGERRGCEGTGKRGAGERRVGNARYVGVRGKVGR